MGTASRSEEEMEYELAKPATGGGRQLPQPKGYATKCEATLLPGTDQRATKYSSAMTSQTPTSTNRHSGQAPSSEVPMECDPEINPTLEGRHMPPPHRSGTFLLMYGDPYTPGGRYTQQSDYSGTSLMKDGDPYTPGGRYTQQSDYSGTSLMKDGNPSAPGGRDLPQSNYSGTSLMNDGNPSAPGGRDLPQSNYSGTSLMNDGNPSAPGERDPSQSNYSGTPQMKDEKKPTPGERDPSQSNNSRTPQMKDGNPSTPGERDPSQSNNSGTSLMNDGKTSTPGERDPSQSNYSGTPQMKDGKTSTPGERDLSQSNYSGTPQMKDGKTSTPGERDLSQSNYSGTPQMKDEKTSTPGERDLSQSNYSGTPQMKDGKTSTPGERDLSRSGHDNTSYGATQHDKEPKSLIVTTSPTLTGEHEDLDHGQPQSMDDKGRKGDKGHGRESPSAAGGEGHQYDSLHSIDSDDDKFVHISPSEVSQVQQPTHSDANQTWKGMLIQDLKRTPDCLPPDLKLERSKKHYIAVRTPFEYRKDTVPAQCLDGGRWDTDHVRMPFANESKCYKDGKFQKRWDVIVAALKDHIQGPFELEEAILKYNQRYINKWNFTVLHHFFLEVVSREEREEFFNLLLPEIIRLALRLPDVCCVIPLLKKGKPQKLTLSQYQIACLLANAFLCTFPLRSSRTRGYEYSDFPDINFSHLFVGEPVPRKMQKLRCIVHYFKRVIEHAPTGIVTFSRQVLSSPYEWYKSMDSLTRLHVSSTGTIEDNGRGMLQVDFANKNLGGGVLGHGCVQEEIRFLICPEMIITRLFTQSLDPLESLVMTGCERYSNYKGYSDSFRWSGDYVDPTERDYLGRLACEVVAIDAQIFKSDYNKQFKRDSIERELNKAYSGFKTNAKENHTPAVCTGNWGCGAFGGDKQLKALIQIMAASVSRRDVCYFTFGDERLTKELFDVHNHLQKQDATVGAVYHMLLDYGQTELTSWKSPSRSLFEFIHYKLSMNIKPTRRSTKYW